MEPGTLVYTAAGWESVASKARQYLETHHQQFPLRKWAPKEELRSRLGLAQQAFNHVLSRLKEDGAVVEEGALVRLPEHRSHLTDAQQKTVKTYLELLDSQPFAPPTDSPVDAEVLNWLVDQGKVARVSESVVFSSTAYKEMVDRISGHLTEKGEITVADVRDMFGASRKYALALMDHLDQQRITRRVGDVRVLR